MRKSRSSGFTRAGQFLQSRIRQGGEARGFANTRLLTHWPEIIGPDLAAITRPVQMKYPKGAIGGVLEVLTTGANAPLVAMRCDDIRTKVNAVFGYNAVAKVQITQTAATGFAEGRVDFTHKPKSNTPTARVAAPETIAAAKSAAEGVQSADLKAALESLGQKIISKS